MAIKLNALKTRFTAITVLAVLIPILVIGWVAHNAMFETIRAGRISNVGHVADAKHDQLVMMLKRQNIRAEHFLADLSNKCGGNATEVNHPCATGLISSYLTAEGATGATLHRNGGNNLIVGTLTAWNEENVRFKTGQLARFSGNGPVNNRSYFISVADEAAEYRLEITYPSSQLEPVFNQPPRDLGLSGETFLTDGEGYFVTKPRYTSTQGHEIPIFAHPMQACLSGRSDEMLDLDYRDIAIIHGFRFIPEFGSACIMAHIDQSEAFAPLKSLQQKIIITILLFGVIMILIAVYLARSVVEPIIRLTKVVRAIASGDYQAQAEATGSDEIAELATSFNFMTDRLHESHDKLHNMLNSMVEGMYGVDTEGNCTFVNQSFLTRLGFQNESEVLGRNMHELIHYLHADGSPYPISECKIYCALRDNQAANIADEVFWRKDGVAIPVEYWSHPILTDGVVTGSIVTFVDITERRKAEENINLLAFYDPLTMLPNRRLLRDRLQQAMAVSARSGSHGALLFLDMDHFKGINDTQGHMVGDLLLIEAARRLQTCVREGDSVARLGGDEFVVLLEDLSNKPDEAATQSELVAEKIRAQLAQPYLLNNYECHITTSIGVSLFFNHMESMDDLLRYADVAMYQAKTAGRNAIRFFDPRMQMILDERTAMEADLHQALVRRQFRLHYQVQVDSNGRVNGAEALLRWEHEERGMVFPDQFVPLAEEVGLIVPIGLWVLQTACAQLKAWQYDALTRDLTLAVNVSARQFSQADFVSQVRRVLLESGARPSLLKLELTESTVLKNVEATIGKMQEIKLLGVSFSMDDFGTGYSSLQYLKCLPLDQIKIDRSFVFDITSDPHDAAIVQAIIAITQALGLNVLAEGVETEAQREFLEKHGCHAFQGYLYSKPVPLEQLEKLLVRFAGHQ